MSNNKIFGFLIDKSDQNKKKQLLQAGASEIKDSIDEIMEFARKADTILVCDIYDLCFEFTGYELSKFLLEIKGKINFESLHVDKENSQDIELKSAGFISAFQKFSVDMRRNRSTTGIVRKGAGKKPGSINKEYEDLPATVAIKYETGAYTLDELRDEVEKLTDKRPTKETIYRWLEIEKVVLWSKKPSLAREIYESTKGVKAKKQIIPDIFKTLGFDIDYEDHRELIKKYLSIKKLP